MDQHDQVTPHLARYPSTLGNALWTDWIPPSAGMNGVSKGVPSQMTPTARGANPFSACNI
jgi:hypothetical protein